MREAEPVPKLIGGDVELANFILGRPHTPEKTDYEASRRLLAQVDGLPRRSDADGFQYTAPASDEYVWQPAYGFEAAAASNQDFGRRYLPANGGCIYIDQNHFELATPEALGARQYQAVWSSMLRIARQAQRAANEHLPDGERIVLLANNSDRQGKSYGGHQSFLLSRRAWDSLMRQPMFPGLFYLMAYQASSIVFTGQGKVGSENGHPPVRYQISQRADFIETLLGIQTTERRPLVNTRDEPLCGPRDYRPGSGRPGGKRPGDRYARLHVIFFDTNLAPVATFLKVGVTQLILVMIEAGFIARDLLLENPLAAVHGWSRDPDLGVRQPTITGQRLSAVELQLEFLEQARQYEASHGFDDSVADAREIIRLWEDTLLTLQARDFDALRGRIDWIMKRSLLEQALARHPDRDWASPEITHMDQIYSSLDPADGLFLALDASGCIEPVASEAEIDALVTAPPPNTRAWTRAMLLRALDPERIAHVDWDRILVSSSEDAGQTRIELPDPLGATRARSLPAFSGSAGGDELIRRLQRCGIDSSTNQYTYPGTSAGPYVVRLLPTPPNPTEDTI